jgi:hypothetical protein
MSVERASEWSADFDGTLADLERAVAEVRDAGAPGGSEIKVSGGGSRYSLTARYFYDPDDGAVEDEVPSEPEGVKR